MKIAVPSGLPILREVLSALSALPSLLALSVPQFSALPVGIFPAGCGDLLFWPLKATGEEYAVKIMQLAELKDERRSKDGDEGSDDEDDRCLSLREINNELSMMCKLSHPNIIKIHEFFVQDGQCFVVMQLLQGPELMDALVEIGQKAGKDDGEVGSYTEADARTVMASLTDAIAYMHEAGITHRDLKLENLVLAEPGKLSSVVIVDFGLAKVRLIPACVPVPRMGFPPFSCKEPCGYGWRCGARLRAREHAGTSAAASQCICACECSLQA